MSKFEWKEETYKPCIVQLELVCADVGMALSFWWVVEDDEERAFFVVVWCCKDLVFKGF